MRSLRALEAGQELECVGTRDSQEVDVFLRGEDGLELAGRLTGTPEGFEPADGSWTINLQRGFLRFTQIVMKSAHNVEVAHCEGTYGSQSSFLFASGRGYIFGTIHTGSRWVFQSDGAPVLTFTMPQWWRAETRSVSS